MKRRECRERDQRRGRRPARWTLSLCEFDAKELAAPLDEIQSAAALGAWREELLGDAASILVHSTLVAVDEKSRSSAHSQLERPGKSWLSLVRVERNR